MGYNKGDNYEQHIFDLLKARGLLASNSMRAGAGNSTDIRFLSGLQEYNLEIKLDLEADYGQKMMKWEHGIWSWCVNDVVTSFYTSVGVLDIVTAKNFIPNRYSLAKDEITERLKIKIKRLLKTK
jgi:hypothetical protein